MASPLRVTPEQHFLPPTPHVPNSKLPILVYRSVLPRKDWNDDRILELWHGNKWFKGGQWKEYKVAHFHSNTHEGYAVISGKSTLSLGKSPIDEDKSEEGKEHGIKIEFQAGDCFVLPAGVAHCSLESEGDYEYIGFYPDGSPKWNMNYCKEDPETTRKIAVECYNVPIPSLDPIYGDNGPLPKIWQEADH